MQQDYIVSENDVKFISEKIRPQQISSNDNFLVMPQSTNQLVGRDTPATLTNKIFVDAQFTGTIGYNVEFQPIGDLVIHLTSFVSLVGDPDAVGTITYTMPDPETNYTMKSIIALSDITVTPDSPILFNGAAYSSINLSIEGLSFILIFITDSWLIISNPQGSLIV